MRFFATICFFWALVALPISAEGLPSGLAPDLQEVLFEPAGAPAEQVKLMRLRLVAMELADQQAFGFDAIEADFQKICETLGVEIAGKSAPNTERIIISLASDAIAFGESAPNVIQYFDVFRVADGTCVWDG